MLVWREEKFKRLNIIIISKRLIAPVSSFQFFLTEDQDGFFK